MHCFVRSKQLKLTLSKNNSKKVIWKRISNHSRIEVQCLNNQNLSRNQQDFFVINLVDLDSNQVVEQEEEDLKSFNFFVEINKEGEESRLNSSIIGYKRKLFSNPIPIDPLV